MNALGRAPLILGLALAHASSAGALPTTQRGRALGTAPRDGTVLAERENGVVLLVLASDTVIHDGAGPLQLDDIHAGDGLAWAADDGERIAMIAELVVTPHWRPATRSPIMTPP